MDERRPGAAGDATDDDHEKPGDHERINIGSDEEPDWIRVEALPIGCVISFENVTQNLYVPPDAALPLAEAIKRLGKEMGAREGIPATFFVLDRDEAAKRFGQPTENVGAGAYLELWLAGKRRFTHSIQPSLANRRRRIERRLGRSLLDHLGLTLGPATGNGAAE